MLADEKCPDCGARLSYYSCDPEWCSRDFRWSCGRAVGSLGPTELRETAICGVKAAGVGVPVVELVLADIERDDWRPVLGVYERCYDALQGCVGPDNVAELLRARAAKGEEHYGHPLRAFVLKPNGSRYDWRQEAAEELADALLYLRAALEVENA